MQAKGKLSKFKEEIVNSYINDKSITSAELAIKYKCSVTAISNILRKGIESERYAEIKSCKWKMKTAKQAKEGKQPFTKGNNYGKGKLGKIYQPKNNHAVINLIYKYKLNRGELAKRIKMPWATFSVKFRNVGSARMTGKEISMLQDELIKMSENILSTLKKS